MDATRQGPAHPVALAALGLLVFNDWIAKVHWPSPVTGKLSDVAWLALAPVVVASALAALGVPARAARAAAVGGVGVAFVVLQVWPPLGDAWVALTGGAHVADVEDLLCLPALALPALAWRGRPRRGGAAVLPFAAFACAATSYIACPTVRLPQDGEAAWDPNEPLALGFGLFGHAEHDTAGVVAAIHLATADGEEVPFVATTDGQATHLCPIGGLAPDTAYVWTVDPMTTGSANHVQPDTGGFTFGTTRFRTAATSAFEPVSSERACADLVAEVQAARDRSSLVCGDTGFDDTGVDTGAP